MADPVNLSNFQKKKANAVVFNRQRDENALQQRMFKEMEEAELLKVTSIGATVDIFQGVALIARIVCLTKESAEAKREFMMKFFIEHAMNWKAIVQEQQFF